MSPNEPTINLSSCDRDPIQYIASVQSHGVFIAFSADDLRITNVSENADEILPGRPEEVVGRRLDIVLPAELVTHIRESMRKFSGGVDFLQFQGSLGRDTELQEYDCYLYPSEKLMCIEIEAQERRADPVECQVVMSDCVRDMNAQKDFRAAGKSLAQAIRKLTGMDRVMIYRFMPKVWHGEVIAEDRTASAHSFMNHRFPATDIPKPARDLYLRNGIRFIKDPKSAPCKITPSLNPRTGKVLDLSDSRLRAVPAVHLEYLKNMQVASSFSVAIVVEGTLWGLAACHHFETISIPYTVRQACATLATSFAGRLRAEEQCAEQGRHLHALMEVQDFVLQLRDSLHPVSDFMANHRQLANIFKAQGLALVQGPKVEIAGLTPPSAVVTELAERLGTEMHRQNKSWIAVNRIGEIDGKFAEFKLAASGVLAIRVPGELNAIFFLFRPETIQTIQWGGDPRKQLEKRNYQGVINPRVSFETWTETVEGTSTDWTDEEIRSARFLVDLVFQTFLEKERLMGELLAKSGRV